VTSITKKLTYKIGEKSFKIYHKDYECFELNIGCAVNSVVCDDVDEEGYLLSQEKLGDKEVFTWTGRSNIWEKKEYILEIYKDNFLFRVKIYGEGTLGKVDYFSRSSYEFSRYFIPNPLGGALTLPQYHSPEQDGTVAMQYSTPPLLGFSFEFENGWLSMGIAPQPGNYNFEKFDYEYARSGCFALSTDFMGYTKVNGEFELPGIMGGFGSDEYDALASYADGLYEFCGYKRKSWSDSPRWWYGPLFCGWSEQAAMNPENQFDAANQKNYEDMSRRLDEFGLKPTAIIIDDKWQTSYGESLPDPEKWPDLRGFTDREHEKGRKIVLWFKSWNHEGLDADECVRWYSLPQGADPTSPLYIKRVEDTLYKLLSSEDGCYNCDGFKIDFANVMPHGKNLKSYGNVYGIELLKELMKLIYNTAKSIKPDCLINNSCSHPYFAEVTDQCRLHDYAGTQRSAWTVMSYRYRLYQAAMPGVLIDTDTVRSNYRETLDYINRCGELGAPDLYFLSNNAKVNFDDQILDALKVSWGKYSDQLDGGEIYE